MTTVLWDLDDDMGLVVEPKDRFVATFEALKVLREATTVGQVQSAELPEWARSVVETFVDNLWEEDVIVTDDTPFDASECEEALIDAVPMPHDAESTSQWLGRGLLQQHAVISGASPGGNIDGYQVRDTHLFLEAIRDHGYELERLPGLMRRYYEAL